MVDELRRISGINDININKSFFQCIYKYFGFEKKFIKILFYTILYNYEYYFFKNTIILLIFFYPLVICIVVRV